jgi:hypothetical protein
VNLAWWLAWTSNPVVVYRKVGWVGSIPMHLRQSFLNHINDLQIFLHWIPLPENPLNHPL